MRNTLPRRLFAALILATPALLTACGSPPTPPPPPVTAPAETHELTQADVDAWLDGKLPDALTKGKATGAVVTVVKDGEILTNRGYGHAERGGNGRTATPVDPETTIFRWGSISKVPTAIAAMQLVEQGKLDLDADIATHTDVPIGKHHSHPITLRHLLNHTAGFEDSIGSVTPALKNLPLADYVRHNPPVSVYSPGTTPAYSNYGITLAGYLVEQASGQPFQEYVKEHVLNPAGMTTASHDQPLPEETLALAYDDAGQPHPFQTLPDVPAGTLAGAGTDAAAFMLAQLNHSPSSSPRTAGNSCGPRPSPRRPWAASPTRRAWGSATSPEPATATASSNTAATPSTTTPSSRSIPTTTLASSSPSPARPTLRTAPCATTSSTSSPTATSLAGTPQTPRLEGSTERAQQVAGSYGSSRAVVNTWLSAWWSTLQQETILALPNGNLLYRGKEYTETAPWTRKTLPH